MYKFYKGNKDRTAYVYVKYDTMFSDHAPCLLSHIYIFSPFHPQLQLFFPGGSRLILGHICVNLADTSVAKVVRSSHSLSLMELRESDHQIRNNC